MNLKTERQVLIHYCGPLETWSISSVEDSIYFQSLRLNYDVKVVSALEADIFFVNETLASRKDYLKKYRPEITSILICQEAFSPDFNLFDYAIGFDPIQYQDRYMRFNIAHRFGDYAEIKPSSYTNLPERRYCEFIYSNPSANPIRDLIKFELEKKYRIDSLGKHLNNLDSRLQLLTKAVGWERAKVEIQSDYLFSICAENAFHIGYTSEKIFTSFAAKSIPIYWGNPQINLDVNPKRIINAHDFLNFDDLREHVENIYLNKELAYEIIDQPIFTELQLIDRLAYRENLSKFLSRIVSESNECRKRRSEGTFSYDYFNTVKHGLRVATFEKYFIAILHPRKIFQKMKTSLTSALTRKRTKSNKSFVNK